MANRSPGVYPSTGLADLLRLAGRLVRDYVRSPSSFDGSDSIRKWIKATAARLGSDDFIINLLVTRLMLVTGPDLSRHILEQVPGDATFVAGPNKVNAMSFLAPQALTICQGEQWSRLRQYNEAVLDTGRNSQRQQAILDQVLRTFASPISGVSDIRQRMSAVMLGVVFGEGESPAHLAEDIQVLFGYVTSPIRRILLGWRERSRRARFYGALAELWSNRQDSDHPSLLTTAHQIAPEGNHRQEELLNQIPHWMFTFTGSGTDLLSRTLAMVSSRPDVRDKLTDEIAGAGSIEQADNIDQLRYLEACLLETCRLFPPVTRTSHAAPNGGTFGGTNLLAGVEIIHYFPVNYRDTGADPSANNFQPERWLDPAQNAPMAYPNLFLSGPRACPGKDLILFICKAALAVMLTRHRLTIESPALATDPLPFSFPADHVHISSGRRSQ
ncbi:MAG TPA: cytochrome P450 [Dehalococcoidia bacterium]|nr:cytochrome P450 [Dehalococcoidia bacterium]